MTNCNGGGKIGAGTLLSLMAGASLLFVSQGGCRDQLPATPSSAPAAEVLSPTGSAGASGNVVGSGAAGTSGATNAGGGIGGVNPSVAARDPNGVDGADDSRGPAWLPKTGKSGPWVKREAVKVYDAGELAKATSAEDAARLGFFRIRTIARCAYGLPHGAGLSPLARVLIISAETVEDAYGILTCRSKSDEHFRIGGQTRVERGDGIGLHCWQGTSYVHLQTSQSDAETTEELIRLANHICGRIRREDLPAIVDALPCDPSLKQHHWLVRNLSSVSPASLELAGRLDVVRLNAVLGLSRETSMCIGVYEGSGAAQGDVVWVVRYPNVRAAHEAHGRYQKYLASDKGEISESTNLLGAQGIFLVGTWTAEEESMMYMLPRIKQLLPG